MNKLGLITFDLDNTLWSVEEVIVAAEAEWVGWLRGAFPEHPSAFGIEPLRAQRKALLERHPEFLHDLSALRIRTIQEALIGLGVAHLEASRVAEEAFDVFHIARNRVTLFEGTLDVLRELSERFVIGALTNGNADLRKIGIAQYFDFHHSSETIGLRKPAPDMFHAGLKSANMGADVSVHVGDHPLEDVEAARQAGYRAVWFNPEGRKWPSDLEPPTHSIGHLSELLALADRIHGG